jgi:hypothetical protein
MAIPDNQKIVAEIAMKGLISAGGSGSVNTNFLFHYRRTSVVNVPSKTALDTAFQAAHAAPIIAALNARWSQKTNDVRWVNDALDQPLTIVHVNAGAIAGDSLASHIAVYVLFRTGIRGRSFRGSKHFGPFSEGDVTAAGDDILNAAAIARLATITSALITPLVDANGNTWNLAVLSRVLSVITPNPTTIVTTDVSSILTNKRVANMKRRQVASVY